MEEEVIEYLNSIKNNVKNEMKNNRFERLAKMLIKSGVIETKDKEDEMGKAYFVLGQIFSYNYSMNDTEKELIELFGVKKNIDKAIVCYEKGMNEYKSFLCVNKLYNIYYFPQEGLQNYHEAFRIAKIGASFDDELYYFRVGEMLLNGKGTKKDVRQAYLFFKKSFSSNPALGGYELAVMKEKGEICEKNEQEAFKLYQAAAAAGDKLSIYKLGLIYAGKYKGQYKFVEKDIKTAEKYFEKYLSKENRKKTYALKFLGMLRYENGDQKEKVSGIKKLIKSAKQNDDEANFYLKTKTSYGSFDEQPNQNIVAMQENALCAK